MGFRPRTTHPIKNKCKCTPRHALSLKTTNNCYVRYLFASLYQKMPNYEDIKPSATIIHQVVNFEKVKVIIFTHHQSKYYSPEVSRVRSVQGSHLLYMYIRFIHKYILARILDILILQDKTLFCAFEAGDIVCWLVNQPIAKLDLFKSSDCRWICKTYAEYSCRSSATVCRLVQSPTLQSTIFCGVHSDLRGKGIRVSPAWY